MTTSKVTNRIALTYALENLPDAPAEIREKWEKMVAQLDHKNASPKKLTDQQIANEGFKSQILEFLRGHGEQGFTCSELIAQIPELEGVSNQRVSALMRLMKIDGQVESYSEKRRTYFKAV